MCFNLSLYVFVYMFVSIKLKHTLIIESPLGCVIYSYLIIFYVLHLFANTSTSGADKPGDVKTVLFRLFLSSAVPQLIVQCYNKQYT